MGKPLFNGNGCGWVKVDGRISPSLVGSPLAQIKEVVHVGAASLPPPPEENCFPGPSAPASATFGLLVSLSPLC